MWHARAVRFENLKTTASLPVAPPVPSGCSLRSWRLHRGAGLGVGAGIGVGRYGSIERSAHGTAPAGNVSPGELPGLVDPRAVGAVPCGAHEHVIATTANATISATTGPISRGLMGNSLGTPETSPVRGWLSAIAPRTQDLAVLEFDQGEFDRVRRCPCRIPNQASARRFRPRRAGSDRETGCRKGCQPPQDR